MIVGSSGAHNDNAVFTIVLVGFVVFVLFVLLMIRKSALTGWSFLCPREAIAALDRAWFCFVAYMRCLDRPIPSGSS